MAEQTRRTGHSTLGLIRGLQRILPPDVAEHVYHGATVQDVTDSWFGLVMRDVGELAGRELAALHARLLQLADAHRDTIISAHARHPLPPHLRVQGGDGDDEMPAKGAAPEAGPGGRQLGGAARAASSVRRNVLRAVGPSGMADPGIP